MQDAYDLARFVNAQNPVFEQVVAELKAGRKASHWMWFIFPQMRGLGSSPTAIKFAIASRAEAEAYLIDKILGPRLIECSQLVLDIDGSKIDQIFDYPDNLKFHSSMSLFDAVARPKEHAEQSVFDRVLEKYFHGRKDSATIDRLR